MRTYWNNKHTFSLNCLMLRVPWNRATVNQTSLKQIKVNKYCRHTRAGHLSHSCHRKFQRLSCLPGPTGRITHQYIYIFFDASQKTPICQQSFKDVQSTDRGDPWHFRPNGFRLQSKGCQVCKYYCCSAGLLLSDQIPEWTGLYAVSAIFVHTLVYFRECLHIENWVLAERQLF